MKRDVAAYYEQTQNHYQRWWQLDRGMALHYGLWYENTKSFVEALENTNKYMARQAAIGQNNLVLDAGCGVGGAAIFMAKNYAARVHGISLSDRQITTARENAKKHAVSDLVVFSEADYTQTTFEDGCFDVIWACESSSSAPDKEKMLLEWHRLLKPGGKLILLDFFKTAENLVDKDKLLEQWCALWAMSPLVSPAQLRTKLEENNFHLICEENLTKLIEPTIRWMYKSYLLGSLPAILYNLFFGAREYSKNHYKSGLYQYKAYQRGLWQYYSFLAQKSDAGHEIN